MVVSGAYPPILRGSLSAKLVAAAWSRLILTSIERLIRGLGVYAGAVEPQSHDVPFATEIEVVVISPRDCPTVSWAIRNEPDLRR